MEIISESSRNEMESYGKGRDFLIFMIEELKKKVKKKIVSDLLFSFLSL